MVQSSKFCLLLALAATWIATLADVASPPSADCEVDGKNQCGKENDLEDGAFMQTRTRHQGHGKKGCWASGCPCDFGICYMFGDPHFFTFDGGKTVYNHKAGGKPMHMWVVHSPDVHIQAISASYGYARGIAFGGPFLQGHTLMMLNQNVTWDGNPIMLESGDRFNEEGLASLSRVPKNKWFGTDFFDNVTGNVSGGVAWWTGKDKRQTIDQVKRWWKFMNNRDSGADLGAMHFKLPFNVEGWITGVNRGMQLLLRMPSQPNQCGYCGNFDGKAENDESPEKQTFWLKARKAAGCMLDPIEPEDDLFGEAALSQLINETSSSASLVQEVSQSCSQEMMRTARAACKHVPEDDVRDACEMDVCFTGDADSAKAAELMDTMHIAFARAAVEFQGHGECKDETGESYTTLDAEGLSDEINCLNLVHRLAHDPKLLEQGIEGVQFNNQAKACQVLLEAGGTYDEDFIDKLPGLWSNLHRRSGAGIVSKVTEVDGWSCWKIV